MFDLSITKLLVLLVLALVIFGPDQLPKIAGQLGRAIRDLRNMAEKAKADLTEGLGPEFADFDLSDLNPKAFVSKHLFDEPNGSAAGPAASGVASHPLAREEHPLPRGQRPPFDMDAT
ncbi:MAG TPA: sec-independent translocase [Streptosporangiaceae bacterium]